MVLSKLVGFEQQFYNPCFHRDIFLLWFVEKKEGKRMKIQKIFVKKVDAMKMDDLGQKIVEKLKEKNECCHKHENSNLVGLDSLTIHGLPRVISSPSGIVKVCWFLLFSASMLAFIFIMKSSHERYKEGLTYKKTSWDYQTDVEFPSVTICNSRKSDPPEPRLQLADGDASSLLQTAFVNKSQPKAASFDEFSFGYSIIANKSTRFCIYGNSRQGCDQSMWHVSDLAPGCLIFNPYNGFFLNQTEAGEDQGLQLLVYINTSHDRPEPDRSTHGDILLSIHHRNVYPDFWSNKISLELGFFNRIQLKRTMRTTSFNCVDRYPSNLYFPGLYDQSVCQASCKLRSIYSKCGDVWPEYRRFFTYSILPKLRVQNVNNVTECLSDMRQQKHAYKDECGCYTACRSVTYHSSTVTSSWLSNEKIEVLKKELRHVFNRTLTEKDVRNNFTMLNIYYNVLMTYTEEEELAYGLLNLVADCGGMMGLCIGASIFSLLEIAFVIVIWCVDKIRSIMCWIRKSLF